MRLDKVLQGFGFSRRQAKILIKEGRVYVDGQAIRRASYEVTDVNKVKVLQLGQSVEDSGEARILIQKEPWLAIEKKKNVHSVQGKSPNNVENWLKQIFPENTPFLLNRIDFLTSGILLAGFGQKALFRYKSYQVKGLTQKVYLAKVRGYLDRQLTIKNKIDDYKRKKVKVLAEDDPDSLRHTLVCPLWQEKDTTLIKAIIYRGKRHQIRAHLSYFGFPLLGDPLYADKNDQINSDLFCLHHTFFSMPEFKVLSLPHWLDLDQQRWVAKIFS